MVNAFPAALVEERLDNCAMFRSRAADRVRLTGRGEHVLVWGLGTDAENGIR